MNSKNPKRFLKHLDQNWSIVTRRIPVLLQVFPLRHSCCETRLIWLSDLLMKRMQVAVNDRPARDRGAARNWRTSQGHCLHRCNGSTRTDFLASRNRKSKLDVLRGISSPADCWHFRGAVSATEMKHQQQSKENDGIVSLWSFSFTDVENDIHGFALDFKPIQRRNGEIFQVNQLALFSFNGSELIFWSAVGIVGHRRTLNRATLSLSVLLNAETLLLLLAMIWELDLILTELADPWHEFICIGRTISSILNSTLFGPLMACCFLNRHLKWSQSDGYVWIFMHSSITFHYLPDDKRQN